MTPETQTGATDHLPTADLLWDAIQSLSEGIAVYDADHRLVTFNQQYRNMFPMIADLIVQGVRWDDLLRAGADRGQYKDALGRAEDWLEDRLGQGVPIGQALEVSLTDGTFYKAQFSATKRGGFVVANTDITERKKAELAAQEQAQLLRKVLETSPVAVVMAQMSDGKILYRSPRAIQMYGDTECALKHYADPKDRDTYIAALTKSGALDDYRLTIRLSDGATVPATCWGRVIEFEGETCVVSAVVDLSERQAQEEMIRHVLEACPAPIQMTKAETGEVLFSSPETISLFGTDRNARTFYANTKTRDAYLQKLKQDRAIRDFKAEYVRADGSTFSGSVSARLIRYNEQDVIVSHTRDLTDQLRIEAELAQQQNQLYQNEKMSAMGELLAGVAHELNNPLSVVVGHSLMLQEDCTDPETLRQVDKISHAAERCAKIVKTFLTMARQEPAKQQSTNINEIVQTAVDVVRYGDGGGGPDITCDLAKDLPLVAVDPDQMTQVFINLILNAEQAISKSGKGTKIVVRSGLSTAKDGVEVWVEDDGPGIPVSIRSRIFEPFFTTKDVGEGTGIGLALCHRIVKTHDGGIVLGETPEGGASFQIYLPQDIPTQRHSGKKDPSDTRPSEIRVLIVDDEEDVAELNAEILIRGGYTVDMFNVADQALESLRNQTYDIILSDLNMPDTDGRGFFEAISQDFPEMVRRIGFVTGDTMGRYSQTFLVEAQRPYIEKPVSPKELRGFVSDILNKLEQGNA
ncbi:ATP-binding protein [Roseovarius rhodophyticola]|uniref:histidine kinase n=1 Tax=Roseovarius rhodophyticola TaxID=3080827 RepID=A0ABZ2TJQ3_9RHOB|nr:ATP-binding protein [Roseovarius sp. W115]MDV2930296.1 PAS-domain containing protein [Roseovarius sp. W115]